VCHRSGFAAVRDPVSFFRYAAADDEGNANPLAGAIRYALCVRHITVGSLPESLRLRTIQR